MRSTGLESVADENFVIQSWPASMTLALGLAPPIEPLAPAIWRSAALDTSPRRSIVAAMLRNSSRSIRGGGRGAVASDDPTLSIAETQRALAGRVIRQGQHVEFGQARAVQTLHQHAAPGIGGCILKHTGQAFPLILTSP